MRSNQRLPIEPELYLATLERLALQSVCLDEVRACCGREVAQDGQVNITLSADGRDNQAETQYFAFINYHLRGQREGEMLLEVDAKYRLVFDSIEPVPEGFFEVFSELNLHVTTMPYFRELVASITGRMEIPTLTLPYAIYAAPQKTSEEQDPAVHADKAKKPRTRKPRAVKD